MYESSYEEKYYFFNLGRMASRDLMDGRTDKCKISIVMLLVFFCVKTLYDSDRV